MAYRGSMMFALGTLLLPVTSLTAAETYARGGAVAREMASADGSRFLVTATPPADRGVDPKVFEAFEIVAGRRDAKDGAGARATSRGPWAAFQQKPGPGPEVEAVDLSGYHLKIESVSAASCLLDAVVKFKKVNLNGHRFVTLEVPGASGMFATVYPTKGDVDTAIFPGDSDEPCDVSERNAGELDLAACTQANCSGATSSFTGVIANPLSSSASYVGGVQVVFVN